MPKDRFTRALRLARDTLVSSRCTLANRYLPTVSQKTRFLHQHIYTSSATPLQVDDEASSAQGYIAFTFLCQSGGLQQLLHRLQKNLHSGVNKHFRWSKCFPLPHQFVPLVLSPAVLSHYKAPRQSPVPLMQSAAQEYIRALSRVS